MKKVLIILSLLFGGSVLAHNNGSEHVHNRGLYDRGHYPNHGVSVEVWCSTDSYHSHSNIYYDHAHYYTPRPTHRNRYLRHNNRHLRNERLRRGHHPRARRTHYYDNYNNYYYRPSVCIGNRNVSLCVD